MGDDWDEEEYDEEAEAEEKGYDDNRRLKFLGIDPEMDPINRMFLINQMADRLELLANLKKAGILEHGPRNVFRPIWAGVGFLTGHPVVQPPFLASLPMFRPISPPVNPAAMNDNIPAR